MIVILQPKRTKFKRLHKGVVKKCKYKQSTISLQQGAYGLRVLKRGRLTSKQLEQARRKIITVRKKREKQKIWFRCIPDIPVTAKPLGIRMGKGKGGIKYWISRLPAGKIIMQLNYIERYRALAALTKVAKILPVPTKINIHKALKKKKFKILRVS